MEVSISIFAIVISIIGLIISFLSYKTSNDTRKESSQLKLVDKILECGLIMQTNMVTLNHTRNATETVKCLVNKLDSKNIEKSKIGKEISVVLESLDSIESQLKDFDKHILKVTKTLKDLSLGKEKNVVHRLFGLYVEVGQLTARLIAQSRDLEQQSLLVNTHKSILQQYT